MAGTLPVEAIRPLIGEHAFAYGPAPWCSRPAPLHGRPKVDLAELRAEMVTEMVTELADVRAEMATTLAAALGQLV